MRVIGRHRTYNLNSMIGRGGEGIIYDAGKNTVAKIYRNVADGITRERKLKKMVEMGLSDNLREFVTWPTDLLYDDYGNFIGFTMRRLESKYLLDTLTEYPNSDNHPHSGGYSSFWTVSWNLAYIVDALHRNEIVIGDVNERNIGFKENGEPVIYDCDSFHISDEMPCTVSRPEYTPFFLYDALSVGYEKYNGKTFSKTSDDWALAVHIFELVCNGCHPFACEIKRGSAAYVPNIPENVHFRKTPFFVYMDGLKPPSYAPSMGLFPTDIRKLFERAFIGNAENIPSASEWMVALDRVLESGFKCVCDRPHHLLPIECADSSNRACPLCIAKKSIDGERVQSDEYTQYLIVGKPPSISRISDYTSHRTSGKDGIIGKAKAVLRRIF